MKTKKVLFAMLVLSFLQLSGLGVVGAQEKEYPEKEIQFLVGWVPGTTMDLSARALAKVASKYLKKPLVVVNMPGAASTVAYNELAKSSPDGYTISVIATGYKSLAIHEQKIPFDPKVLKTLLGYAEYRFVLFVKGDSPYAKLEDLIAYGKKNPDAITFGHAGRGITPHILGVLLFRGADVKAIDVPYKGTPEYIQAVLGGHITAGIVDICGVKEHVKAGTLKLVTVFGDQRLKDFPEIPTTKEKGYAGVSDFKVLIYVCIHRDTPLDRVKKLQDALRKSVEDPEFTKLLEDMGQLVKYIPPESVDETISKSEKMGVPLLKEVNLYVE